MNFRVTQPLGIANPTSNHESPPRLRTGNHSLHFPDTSRFTAQSLSLKGPRLPRDSHQRTGVPFGMLGQVYLKSFLPYQAAYSGFLMRPPMDARIFNFSPEDITSSIKTWTVKIPQIYMAFKYDRHPLEATGRNILTWAMGLGLTFLIKHEKYGVNSLLNQFIMPHQTTVPTTWHGKLAHKLFNNLRPKYNYLDLAKRANLDLKGLGIKGPLSEAVKKAAYWAKLDINELDAIAGLGQSSKTGFKETKAIEGVIHRITLGKMLSVVIGIIAGACLIGALANFLIFRLVAPMDDVYLAKKNKGKVKNTEKQKDPKRPHKPKESKPPLSSIVDKQLIDAPERMQPSTPSYMPQRYSYPGHYFYPTTFSSPTPYTPSGYYPQPWGGPRR